MGDRREGLGANLTPNEASERLPGPVLWVLLRLAVPIFNQTNRAAPGPLVRIQATKNHKNAIDIYRLPLINFPVVLNRLQWEKGVLPVLIDPRWNPELPINQSLLKNNISEYLRLLGIELGNKFSEEGFGPFSV